MKSFLALFVLLFCAAVSVFAQMPPALPSDPAQAPIDGGLAFLAAAGGAYAVRKLRKK